MTEEKLTLMDYPALIALSLRNCFWSRDSLPDLGRGSSPATYYTFVATAALGISAYNILHGIVRLLTRWDVSGCMWRIVIFGFLLWILFDPKYAKHNLYYCRYSWWRDTKIHPSQICSSFFAAFMGTEETFSDRKGLYGEYLASMAAEELILKEKDITGYVFNGVLIPTGSGEGDFAEADIISVSEYGIHVIEVKNWRSFVYGDMDAQNWGRNKNPFRQNLYHCNMLFDYLHEALPDGQLKNRNFNEIMKNVVLFTSPFFRDEVDRNRAFYRSYGGYTQNYLYLKGYIKDGFQGDEKVLSKEEVSRIAEILWKNVYQKEQKKQKMQARIEAAKYRKKYAPSYFVREVECPDIGGEFHPAMVIERTLDGHKAFFDYCDNRFRAMPNYREMQDGNACYVRIDRDFYEDETERCPEEALQLLKEESKGKNVWINDLGRNISHVGMDSLGSLRRWERTGIEILNFVLSMAERLLELAGTGLSYVSYVCMVALGFIGIVVMISNGFQWSILVEALFLIWLFSPWGLFRIFYIGLNALGDFNRYTYELLRKR